MSETQTQIFTDIPPEIWIIIFSNLKITDAANLGRVNKQMWKIYLDLVCQTKYIEYIEYTKYREPPNNDITKYITQHPGGAVILKAGGKNLETVWEEEGEDKEEEEDKS